MSKEAVAIIGGTGDQGLGLALRFARAGRVIRIGSRKPERARACAAEIANQFPGCHVSGHANPDAVRAAQEAIVILSVPFEHTVSTLESLRDALAAPQIVVSMGVPLASAIGDVAARMLMVSQGSCAELCQQRAPEGISVVSAFQNISAHRLAELDAEVDCDVVVSADSKHARTRVMALCEDLPGTRAIDGGPLYNARYVESLTALLIGMNIRYKNRAGAGVRFTQLPL